jgi:hypothetical protein
MLCNNEERTKKSVKKPKEELFARLCNFTRKEALTVSEALNPRSSIEQPESKAVDFLYIIKPSF